ncbi:MAG: DNA repair protein RadA [Flavobacteriales bacterium]
MAKIKKSYFCQNCGAQSPQWVGKCSSCSEWNTYVEEVVSKNEKKLFNTGKTTKRISKPVVIGEVVDEKHNRIIFKDPELNRVLGGGLVHGSLVLFGGEPGIGKSTLMLQMALQHSKARVLYVSGEESLKQIKMRADRIGKTSENCFLLNETKLQHIFAQIEEMAPHILIIDSIQTLHSDYLDSSPGSISQIRECTGDLMKFAKETQTSVFIIGHITKDGSIAGPKVLEHMVDTVLQFEGDRNHIYRLLRTTKNRFGSTNELGIYEMQSGGLIPVENPTDVLLNNSEEALSGVAIASTMEGLRPMLIEVQALVSTAAYGNPQRTTTGFDTKRLNMLLAVLEKRCGFKLGAKDVFLNITGGIRVHDPAIDLAVVCSVLSSNVDMPISKNIALAAEVGLSGEIRPVPHIDQRINEAQKLGFERMIISKYNKGIKQKDFDIELIQVGKIEEVFKNLFGNN